MNTANFAWGCCNCHTPFNGDPGRFIVHLRTAHFGNGMLITDKGKISKIGARLGYPAWHPGGKFIVFSVYNVEQRFHASAEKDLIEQYDRQSDLVVYDIERETIVSVEPLSGKQILETWPDWSPDGRYLYFCSAPVLWSDFDEVPPDNYNKVRYSLVRIAYHAADNTWGPLDTVLSARETGLSISQPRISHDGRFLLFCMHDHGCYPHTQRSSDLYMMDIATGKYRRLDINSGYAETWHAWSSNDRWILFSSKRNDGAFTRIFFSYVDNAGAVHKPFIMPQEDPASYDAYAKCYNVPEFETGPVPFSERGILKAVRSPAKCNVPLPKAAAAQAGPPAWEKLPGR
jgi:hypothetical protein